MKAIIAGGRDFNDYEFLANKLNNFKDHIEEVVCGDARGADKLGARWAIMNNIPVKYFRPDWDYYGRSAGFIRNVEMSKYADGAICFWDGKSHGTKHMIDTMKKANKPYWVFNY